jgi:LuxR family maltose regulon positive regulatory protein
MELWLNGTHVIPSGKTQQRPLMLLKALLVAGSTGRTQKAIADELWPDVEGPKAALNAAIHRLRKLLGNDNTVVVAGGKLSINKTLVWSDINALLDVCDRIDNLSDDAPESLVHTCTTDLLNLYCGPLCNDDDHGWLIAHRERYRNRFLRAAKKLGARLELLMQWSMAHDLYLRALDAEPLAEAIYRGLMRCAHGLNDSPASFSAYQRCCDILANVLDQKPSSETDQLALSLGLLKRSA